MSPQDDPHTPPSPDEEALRDARISQLYRDLPDAAPTPDTDARIRAAARRAVNAAPGKLRRAFAPTLPQLTATAALLVLGVGLVVQWQHRQPEDLARVLATSPASVSQPSTEDAAVAPATEAPPESLAQEKASQRKTTPAPGKKERQVATAPAQPPEATTDIAPAPPAPAPLPAPQQEAETLAEKRQEPAQRLEAQKSRFSAARSDATMRLPYQHAMQAGNWITALEALNTLTTADTPQHTLDRDLLEQLLGRHTPPACRQLAPERLGREKPLCDALHQRIQGQPLPSTVLQELTAEGLVTGPLSYRLKAVEMLLKAP